MTRIHIHHHPSGRQWTLDDFIESEHPRRSDGEFVRKGTGTPVVNKPKPRQVAEIKWTKHDGTSFTEQEHARLKALKIPPAWTRIHLANDPTAALQVVGHDEKGRKQYRYSAAHSERAAAEKFARLKSFNAVAGRIVTAAQNDMFNERLTQQQRDAAAVIKLISVTGFRIGSDEDTKADTRAYGASTLTKDHIKLGNDGHITFEFTGKKGVHITKTIQDHEIYRYLQRRMKTAKAEEKVFDVPGYVIRAYLKDKGGAEFKVKDFRTWNGTNEALKKLAELPEPTDKKTYAKTRLAVARHVAQHLGNTPTVALAAYIDPAVFGKWSHLQ